MYLSHNIFLLMLEFGLGSMVVGIKPGKQNDQVGFDNLTLLEDEPVVNYRNDDLGLLPFGKAIAGIAAGTEGPFTIGVYGRWGHGKTSVMRQAKTLLDDQSPDQVTVWFNAWKFEREEVPLIPLVSSMITAIEEKQVNLKSPGKKTNLKLTKGLQTMGNVLRAVAYGFSGEANVKLPSLAELGFKADAKTMIDRFEKLSESERNQLLEKTFYMDIFERLGQHTQNRDSEMTRPKIIVFIDDLDRCNPDRALRLIESIKLVLTQKGVVFVLAVDKFVIESYLKQRYVHNYGVKEYGEQAGSFYLDKIIQLPFYLPPHQARFHSYVDRILNRPAVSQNAEVQAKLTSIKDLLYIGAGGNPRALIRLINNLLLDWKLWSLLGQSIETDVLAISAVARIIRQHIGEDLFSYFIYDNDLCKQIISDWPDLERSIDDLQKTGGGYRSSHAKKLEILQRLINQPQLNKVFSLHAGVSWLKNHSSRRQVNEFLKQRDETYGGEDEQQDIVDRVVRTALDNRDLDMPETAEFLPLSLDFKNTLLNDSGMAYLSTIEGLCITSMDLSSTGITDEAIRFVPPTTEILNLSATQISGTAFDHDLYSLPLKELYLSGTQITDLGFQTILCQCRDLTTLDVSHTQIADEPIGIYSQDWCRLEVLNVSNTDVGDQFLDYYCNLINGLKVLYLGNTKITSLSPAHPDTWEHLDLQGLDIDFSTLRAHHFNSLLSLNLHKSSIVDSDLQVISQFEYLGDLDISSTAITDDIIEELIRFERLEKLNLSGTRVSNNSMQKISEMSTLKILDLSSTRITNTGLLELRSMKLSELKLNNTNISDEGLESLLSMPQLESLKLVNTDTSKELVNRFRKIGVEVVI